MTKRRKFKPEEIISKLREAEVMLGQGSKVEKKKLERVFYLRGTVPDD